MNNERLSDENKNKAFATHVCKKLKVQHVSIKLKVQLMPQCSPLKMRGAATNFIVVKILGTSGQDEGRDRKVF